MKYININGRVLSIAEASISYDNGAFRYGYGLFETMLYRDGNIIIKQYHWDRLFDGLKQLYFNIPKLMTADTLEAAIHALVKKNQSEKLCRIRLQVFAGRGGLFDDAGQHPSYLIECFSLETGITEMNENGLTVGLAKGLYKSADALANLKSCNALVYAIAARQAKENKWDDALVLNTKSHIIESTIANIFWIKDQVIYTPPLADGCVAGVMRRHLMQVLQEKKIPVIEKTLDEIELQHAEEVFLTNAIRGIKWIKHIADNTYESVLTKSIREFIS